MSTSPTERQEPENMLNSYTIPLSSYMATISALNLKLRISLNIEKILNILNMFSKFRITPNTDPILNFLYICNNMF